MRNPDVVSVGEAAAILGVSVSSVQRLCEAYEANPATGLRFAWTSPLAGRVDVRGRPMKGRRRVARDAVEEYRNATEAHRIAAGVVGETLAERVRRVTRRAQDLGLPVTDLAHEVAAIDRWRHEAMATAQRVLRTVAELEAAIREAEKNHG